MSVFNNKAYTLLETMVVLMIIASLFAIFGFSYIRILDNQTVDSAVNILLSGYENLKTDALANYNDVSLVIDDVDKIITLKFTDHLEERKYPSRASITSNYGSNEHQEININQRGNISRAGTIVVSSGKQIKTITLSIGLGGYDVK